MPRLLLLAAVFALAAGLGWTWWSASREVRQARRELAELERRQAELERSNLELRRQIEALRREPEARARAARDALDVAAPGETIVVLPSKAPVPTPGA